MHRLAETVEPTNTSSRPQEDMLHYGVQATATISLYVENTIIFRT